MKTYWLFSYKYNINIEKKNITTANYCNYAFKTIAYYIIIKIKINIIISIIKKKKYCTENFIQLIFVKIILIFIVNKKLFKNLNIFIFYV
jgi:hypothetical protein